MKGRPVCYIHVGMHKTGSTSIQKSLSGFSDAKIRYLMLSHNATNHSIPIKILFESSADDSKRILIGIEWLVALCDNIRYLIFASENPDKDFCIDVLPVLCMPTWM